MTFLHSLALATLLVSSLQADSNIAFFRGLIKNPNKVGAFFPCSKVCAKEVCSYIDHTHGPLRILEIGSGTGALSQTIVDHMKEGDTIDMVELLPEFCEELRTIFGKNNQVSIYCGSILDWKPDYKYDVIICSVPFNRFHPDLVQSILDHALLLSKSGTKFTYIELMWVSTLKKLFLRGEKKEELKRTMAIMKAFRKKYSLRTEKIYRNITPIYIHHLRFP